MYKSHTQSEFSIVRALYFVISFWAAGPLILAQEYNVTQYRVLHGLPSDIIKACTQDSLGYFWIATDEGIVRYDGVKFRSYRNAMHSNYAKGFFATRDGRLLAYGDLDLIEIQNRGDTVAFKSVCAVDRIPNDTTLSYPKRLFEDTDGNLWVSESQSVVRLNGKSFSRYDFDLANRTPQFLRSFTFFEDAKHDLFVTSFQGNIFLYNKEKDKFELIDIKFPPSVEDAVVEGHRVLIGSADGLWEAALPADGGIQKPRRLHEFPFVSFIQKVDDNRLFIATRSNNHYFLDVKKNAPSSLPTTINNINNIYISGDDDIWLSSNDGLILLRKKLFLNANPGVEDFIEAIDEDSTTGIIYYATATRMFAFDPETRANKLVMELPNGYFQSILATPKGLWVANAFEVFLYDRGKIKTRFDFKSKGRFVTKLTRGRGDYIWLTIPGDENVYRISGELKLESFNVPFAREGVINTIRTGHNGVYVASSGGQSYLFFKGWADSAFHNISVPTKLQMHGDFNVLDLVVEKDQIWMASSEGLLKFDSLGIERVSLGEKFSDLPITSLISYPDEKLLISNAYGLILYDKRKGTFDLYTESSGLLSNTITARGLFVSNDHDTWLGTAKGLCYSSRLLTPISKTPKPKFISANVNGRNQNPTIAGLMDYESFISFTVSSITFPESEITFEYRLSPEGVWIPTTENEIRLASLPAGKYALQVRGKKNGPYLPSDVAGVRFEVDSPYWGKPWFYLNCALLAFVIVGLTTVGVNAWNANRRKQLEELVKQRTDQLERTSHDLRVSNQELISLNEEKNNLISIVAHDLKSPLNQISGIISVLKASPKLDEDAIECITMMDGSTRRLTSMISKILDGEAIETKQLNLKMENLDLSKILQAIVDRFEPEAAKKNITIYKEIHEGAWVNADRTYIEQVFENLISNAIKFSTYDRNVYVKIAPSKLNVVCEIKDEGPGLSEEDKKKLFGKFQKLSARPTGDEISTGLGLSIVKKFVNAMGGEIWCESELGKGASFFVSFGRIKN